MGYADRFYYGQCKLVVNTTKPRVTITDGTNSWELSGSGTVMLPGTNRYIVEASGIQRSVYAGYGDFKTVNI